MAVRQFHVGSPRSRVDGRVKVTGEARYAAEYPAPDLVHGVVVSSAIAKGRITTIDDQMARAVPGVLKIFTHANRPRTTWFDASPRDEVAPPGAPFRPLHDDRVVYSGQPVALVVATERGIARYAASLLRFDYAPDGHATDLMRARGDACEPREKRYGPPAPRGDAAGAYATAPVKIAAAYHLAPEHHNPMEPHATTVAYGRDGKLTIHDKTQGVRNTHGYVTSVFGLAEDDVRIVSPYVGGAFGSGLRPQYQLFLAVMAALDLERSVRVSLSRDQMFSFGFRPETWHEIRLGADRDGRLLSITHEAVGGTSRFEDYQEPVVNWSGMLYRCQDVTLGYKLARLDTATPCDMRAPGAPSGIFALESGLDELAHACGLDPVELRLRNFADRDGNDGKEFSSKELKAAYRQGAERFGWSKRNPAPRSMRDGRDLVGWGMATGVWEAMMMETSARALITKDGKLEVATASADIGPGTYTILAQIAADALGLGMDDVAVRLGDSTLPAAPVEGGSWTAASAGSAVQAACRALAEKLLARTRNLDRSPLGNAAMDHVVFADGRIALARDPSRAVPIAEALHAAGVDHLVADATVAPDARLRQRYAFNSHSAVFAEVRVDAELGIVRVTRIVSAIAAGRILNPKTARSQILGGVVFGVGMALHEETVPDHRLGRFMTHNLVDYHIPVNADIDAIDVIFVAEQDDKVSPLGAKGVGEIGIVGTAAAIANAVFHATGVRVRDLPITVDKVMPGLALAL